MQGFGAAMRRCRPNGPTFFPIKQHDKHQFVFPSHNASGFPEAVAYFIITVQFSMP